MTVVVDGRWQDAYRLRCGAKKVHLAGDAATRWALCGALVKPWSRPDSSSAVCAGCLRKAHRPHRDFIGRVATNRKRRGLRPGPGQEETASGV